MAEEESTINSDIGFVGGEVDLNSNSDSRALSTVNEPVFGGGFNILPKDTDFNFEGYAGVTFDGDWKAGISGDYNLFEKKAKTEEGVSIKVDAMVDLMYATRSGGFVSSMALQAEATLMEGHLKAKALIGYVDTPEANTSGTYGQIRADIDFSKDECTGFMKKGCLTNIAEATFPPEGGYQFRNEFLHDVNLSVKGTDLGLRVGPSIDMDSKDSSITPGVAVRLEF